MTIPSILPALALLTLLTGCAMFEDQPAPTPEQTPRLYAAAETEPAPAPKHKDAADDPAIWVHPADPTRSTVIGTIKRYGLQVYDLQGRVLFSYQTGNPNNVDLRYGFQLGNGRLIDIVACSDRATNEVVLYRVNPDNGALIELSPRIKSALQEVYGICLYQEYRGNRLFVFVNGKDGSIEQYRLTPHGADGVAGIRVRTFRVQTQPEGLVADDRLGVVYLGEEDRGIWKLAADPETPPDLRLLAESTPAPGRLIHFDIEGLAIYPTGDTTGYLLASSQGNNTFAVFERSGSNRYLGSFSIADRPDGLIDGVAETDGIEVTAQNLGGPYAHGMFVAQDGFNKNAQGKATSQNFKLVAWDTIATVLGRLPDVR